MEKIFAMWITGIPGFGSVKTVAMTEKDKATISDTIKCFIDAMRQKIIQDPYQFNRINSTSIGRKTDLQPETQITANGIYAAGSPFQNFLTGPADGDHAAFTRAFCLKIILIRFMMKKAGQMILECNTFMRFII